MADFEFKAPTTRRPAARGILMGAVVVILVVILIWAVVRNFQKAPESEDQASLPDTSQDDGSGSVPAAPDDTDTGDNQSDNSASASDDEAGDSTDDGSGDHEQELTDSGPGETVAVFVAAALLGAAGYELYIRRRLSRSS